MYNHGQSHQHLPTAAYPMNGLQSHPCRSRSVPEGLAHPQMDRQWHNYRTVGPNYRSRPVQIMEQITTTV